MLSSHPVGAAMTAARTIPEADRRAVLRALDDARRSKSRRGALKPGGRAWIATRDAAMIVFAWSSAIRCSELCKVELDQVVADDSGRAINSQFRLRPEQAKGGRPRRVYIGEAARERIRQWVALRGIDRGYLFVASTSWRGVDRFSAFKQWSAWQRRAGLSTRYRWHDLRHTACTRFAEACGGDPYQVQAFSGHTDIRNTHRYVHVSDDRISKLAEGL